MSHDDERFMHRALELARTRPFTHPNPRVGAVVVRDGRVVSEGVHEGPGRPHAEAAALDGIDARGATLYLNLEPCSHHGRTPPCAPLVAASGVARVVAAIEDPDPRVSGDGVAFLRAGGIGVTPGVLAGEARSLNAAYIHHRTTGRPLVTLKAALTFDGRMGAPDGSSRWITGEVARRRVHVRRAEAGCVLVGSGTVAADDPHLTARGVGAPRQPLRVVVDSRGRSAPDRNIFDDSAPTLVATSHTCPHEVQTAWKERGADVCVLPGAPGAVDLDALFDLLGRRDIVEVYCEGGATLASALLRGDLVDRLEIHYGGVVVGRGGPEIGDVGVISMRDARRFRPVAVERTGSDVVVLAEKEET